jgi:hypothetical protein
MMVLKEDRKSRIHLELGTEGRLVKNAADELISSVEEKQSMIRDYSKIMDSPKETFAVILKTFQTSPTTTTTHPPHPTLTKHHHHPKNSKTKPQPTNNNPSRGGCIRLR